MSLLLPDAQEPIELVNVGKFQPIVEALPKRKSVGPNGIINEMLKKLPLLGINHLYLLL
jgi:hypothetical protein